MNYPTMNEVEIASHSQLTRWSRFLPSPGMNWTSSNEFEEKMQEEVEILNKILERLKEKGGITPSFSKQIGWDP